MTDYFDPSRSFERIAQILARCVPPWNMPMIPLAMDVMASIDRVYDASLVVQVKDLGRLAEDLERRQGVDFRSFDAYDNSWMMEEN